MSKIKLKDIITIVNEREDNPANSQYTKFVGLEHYDSGEATITRFGNTDKLASAMKVFHSGDILVARRNVYLRRAAYVNFDGLTSGDSIVIHTKNDSFRRILPFVLNTDAFWDYANQHADGSMSKRLSPQLLMEYEFNMPDEKEIQKQADLLWAMERTKAAYKKLIAQTDELVKSQFIEMFGHLKEDEKSWGLITLGQCCELNPKRPKGIADDLMVSFVPMPAVTEDGHIDCSDIKPYLDVKKGFTYFAERDVLFAKITPCMENGKGAVAEGLSGGIGAGSTEFHVLRPIEGKSNPYWLYIITMFDSFRKEARKVMTGTGGQLRVPIGFLENYPISLPPIELQNEFEQFVRQSDKSKFAAQQALADLRASQKAFMKQIF